MQQLQQQMPPPQTPPPQKQTRQTRRLALLQTQQSSRLRQHHSVCSSGLGVLQQPELPLQRLQIWMMTACPLRSAGHCSAGRRHMWVTSHVPLMRDNRPC
jgi:hypothetical protein